VACHALGDDVVVFDDEDFRHRADLCPCFAGSGCPAGEELVTNR
jgi:hypothetical protein